MRLYFRSNYGQTANAFRRLAGAVPSILAQFSESLARETAAIFNRTAPQQINGVRVVNQADFQIAGGRTIVKVDSRTIQPETELAPQSPLQAFTVNNQLVIAKQPTEYDAYMRRALAASERIRHTKASQALARMAAMIKRG